MVYEFILILIYWIKRESGGRYLLMLMKEKELSIEKGVEASL